MTPRLAIGVFCELQAKRIRHLDTRVVHPLLRAHDVPAVPATKHYVSGPRKFTTDYVSWPHKGRHAVDRTRCARKAA